MCIYLGSEVILANLLAYHPLAKNGIEYSEIERYCEKIKEMLCDRYPQKRDYILFHTYEDSFERNLRAHSMQFYRLLDKYYAKSKVNVDHFNYYISFDLSNILKQAALNL